MSKPIWKCIIIDDEPLAIKVIEQHLAKFPQFEVSRTSTEPMETLTIIKEIQPDLLFLDIQMPGITGLELIESIRSKPEIILTTAYRDYAVEGFELNVLDYLVKPIPFKRFVKAIDKFLEHKVSGSPEDNITGRGFMFVKSEYKTFKVYLDQILYLEGVKDYVKIVMISRKIMTKISIGNFFRELPDQEQFIQVHKSFIVSKNKIIAYSTNHVEVGGVEIPIGRMYKEDFLKAMFGV